MGQITALFSLLLLKLEHEDVHRVQKSDIMQSSCFSYMTSIFARNIFNHSLLCVKTDMDQKYENFENMKIKL